ncbi:MAG: hypothetical protein Q8Q49_01080 [bacterium]|nr:hypothetical protein [bacterium]
MFGKNHWFMRFVVFAFFGFTMVNLMFLNYIVLQNYKNAGQMQVVGSLEKTNEGDTICDTENCVPALYNAIYQATASQKLQQPVTQANQASSGSTQEYYIQLGTGTNSTSSWADVGGVSAYIDSGAYGDIQQVTFEASVSVPTGNQTAYVQLYNKTAQHPVWFSQVSLQGGTPQLLVSSPITLDSGTNLYQVQMMTQLQYPANLTQSRVHIISSN